MKRLLLIIVAVAATAGLMFGCGSDKIENVEIAWTPYDSVAVDFPRSDPPIFLYVEQNNCEYCAYMDTIVFVRAEIAKYINDNFTAVTINVDEDMPIAMLGDLLSYEEFFDLLEIDGLPAYYFFDKDGVAVGAAHRTLDVLTFKRLLKYVNGKFFLQGLTFVEFEDTPEADLDTIPGYF